MWRVSWFVLAFGMTAYGQAVEIAPPAAVARGSADIFRIVFKPGEGKPVAAVQWDLVYPEGLRIEPAGVVSGVAAESAGKSVTCAARPAEGRKRRLSCILVGGVQTLAAGAIAIVRFEAGANLAAGKVSVALEKVTGVSPSVQSAAMKGSVAEISVR